MPDGSSSAAPVISPGPRFLKNPVGLGSTTSSGGITTPYAKLYPVTLATALNVLWALLGAAVLLANLRSERRRTSGRGGLRRWSAVLLVVLALFPCISASDDELGFASLRTSTQSSGAADPVTQQLIRALQALEGCHVSAQFVLSLTV